MIVKVIHYTEDINWNLREIKIDNQFMWCKPEGGLWTSPFESKYGWEQWCVQENFRNDIDKSVKIELELEVDENNLIIIASTEDLNKLDWMPSGLGMEFFIDCIDFVGMKSRGIDCIWLTEEGQWKTRLTFPRNLYGWDCECILILNEKCIKSWRIVKGEEKND